MTRELSPDSDNMHAVTSPRVDPPLPGALCRVQLSRTKGWRMPANTVKVDRSTPWGNPYRAGVHCDHYNAVDCHRFLLTQPLTSIPAKLPGSDVLFYREFALRNLDSLRGKNLACWCPLDKPCHADVLLELANAADTPC